MIDKNIFHDTGGKVIENYDTNGRICIDGLDYGHDVKIIGDTVVPDWWRESGHQMTAEDIEDILAAMPEVLVVGTGYAEKMRISQDAVSRLERLGIRLIAEPTPRAVDTFNRQAKDGKTVAGAFHLTC